MHGPIRLSSNQTVKRLGLLPAGRRRSLTPPDLARLSLVDFSEYSIESSDAAEAGAIHDAELHVLASGDVELHGFPYQRVVRAQSMMSRLNLARGAIAEEQRGERFAVERHYHLPRPHVFGRRALNGQPRACL